MQRKLKREGVNDTDDHRYGGECEKSERKGAPTNTEMK